MSLIRFSFAAIFFCSLLDARAAEVLPPLDAPVCNHVRFFPAPLREEAMVGGKISGSNVSATKGFQVLAEIKEKPREQAWTDLVFPNNKLYRWLRYDAPPGSHGSVGELEFYSGTRRIDGYRYASVGEKNGRGWQFAFDGKPETWVEMEKPDGQFAGIDLAQQATASIPTFLPPPSGVQKPLEVALNELAPFATVRYTLDGTLPTATTGELYTKPIKLDQTTTVTACAFVEGWAASPPLIGAYIIDKNASSDAGASHVDGKTPLGLGSLHVGNTITELMGQFPMYARTAGHPHLYRAFTIPGAFTSQLWNEAQDQRKREWEVQLGVLRHIDEFTLQPRDFNIPEEAQFDRHFIDEARLMTRDVQPWLFVEWVERDRPRPSDKGLVPSTQMTRVFPALTWEESMGAMLVYVEDLQHKIEETDKGPKPVRVLPSNLAMGWIRHQIEHGKFPDAGPDDFYPLLFRDSVHPNANGTYLVALTWYAAFYQESPEGKVLPLGTDLTSEQVTAMQKLAWDVIENYPDCGIFKEGTSPIGKPEFSPAGQVIKEVTPVTLSSSTPGAWFRYTLDGTTPTRTTGYVYCGVISVRPGMTVKAVAFKDGMADSAVADATFSVVPTRPRLAVPQ
ncbi:MAG TPA: chitobiase/beta-hexosaminidase C-terminal domain-containing protein [Chthoniobacter sp.]